ncbi:MAG: hypothetical protein ACYDDI_15860, partial [Candidatus Acidiferrales bacterium]
QKGKTAPPRIDRRSRTNTSHKIAEILLRHQQIILPRFFHSFNCNVGPDSVRAEGVRSTPLPSVSHITTTDAPVAPQKNPPQTTAPEALANHSSLVTGHSSLATSHSPLPSNRYNKLLETDATRTKQRTRPHSNRYK